MLLATFVLCFFVFCLFVIIKSNMKKPKKDDSCSNEPLGAVDPNASDFEKSLHGEVQAYLSKSSKATGSKHARKSSGKKKTG